MKNVNLEEMPAGMRTFASDMLENKYNFRIENTDKFSKKRMSMQKPRDLFLIYKELLNNVSKPSRATNVDLQISVENNILLLVIKDNGRGFVTGKATDRNGLKIMRERVRRWQGTYPSAQKLIEEL